MLASHHKKILAVHACGGKCLLALTCVRDRHRHCGFPLADFVRAKLHPQCIPSVSLDIGLGGAVFVLGLNVLEESKLGLHSSDPGDAPLDL